MYYHKVEICGVNTAKLPVLKEKEKMELIVKAQAGDKEARQKMINGNLRLVLSVVQKFGYDLKERLRFIFCENPHKLFLFRRIS